MGKNLFNRYKEADIVEVPSDMPTIGPTHLATVELLDELLGLSSGASQGLQPIQRLLHRLRPIVLRELATVPEADLQLMLSRIGERIAAAAIYPVTALALPAAPTVTEGSDAATGIAGQTVIT